MPESMLPEDGYVHWRDERRVISLHSGSSPRAADFAFTSISADRAARFWTSPGASSAQILRVLGDDPNDLPAPDALRDGFHVRATSSGVSVVFVVTVTQGADTASLLRTNLVRALRALGSRVAHSTLWLPLMGTGTGGLSMEVSLRITLEALVEVELGVPGRPVRACIDLPAELGSAWQQTLHAHAHSLLTGCTLTHRGVQDIPLAGAAHDKALVTLLAQLFGADELRRWVHFALGEEVHRELPGEPVALNELAFQSVQAAQRRGLVDEMFFARLRAERPAQARRIRDVAELWLDARPAQPETQGTPSQHLRTQLSYPDERTRMLSEELADAYERKQSLEAAGVDTSEVMQEILRVKREIRSGGQLRPGDRLGDNRYLLIERIGRGGFANVWKALDRAFQRQVAIKALHSELAGDVIRRERFFRGARIMAELDHPAVVRIIEPHGEDDDYHYFVMELVAGGDLRRAVLDGRVDASALVPLLLRLGEALAVAHARGLVHRDIKPANVLLTESGDLRLADFDLVSAADTTGGTRTGVLGTLVYAAPELLDRPQEADARADVYGLGMTAAFVLHGADLPREVLRDGAGFIAGLPCDESLKRLLQRAVAWNAPDRFTDAASFCQALRDYVQRPKRIEASRQIWVPDPATPRPVMAESFVEPETGIHFLRVPSGSFTMGARRLRLREHRVEISPFWLAETPVTRAQYERFLQETGRSEPFPWKEPRFGDPNQPAVGMKWLDAYFFCQWASRASGLAVVLPTEAQWEFAARGTDGRPYPWGDEKPTPLRAQFDRYWAKDAPLPVASLPGSRGLFGHLDQAGNVWEWCMDAWDAGAYAARGALATDPVVLKGGDPDRRVVRGGGFTSMAIELHAAYRSSWDQDRGAYGMGFRVAVLPRPPEKTPEAEDSHAGPVADGDAPAS
jgi:formylglycine-generating enzyme required for sulfatase activity